MASTWLDQGARSRPEPHDSLGVADSFPAGFEVLFAVPSFVTDDDLKTAVAQLAETLQSDLVATGAPVEVVMEASACVLQFAKHMQASRKSYGNVEEGGYNDPGAERMALSSIHQGLTSLREALFKLRVVKVSPEQVKAAIDERDRKFFRSAEATFRACRQQEKPLQGEDLMFFVQGELFARMRDEGLVE